MKRMRRVNRVVVGMLLLVITTECERTKAPRGNEPPTPRVEEAASSSAAESETVTAKVVGGEAAPAKEATKKAAPTDPAGIEPATVKVSRIVFVGKEHACDCTRARIDETWASLQAVLKSEKGILVERARIDTEPDRVEPLQKMRAIIVIPAVFFFDASDTLFEMLQGEVTTEQFARVLQ